MVRPAALCLCLAAPAWAQDCAPVPVEPGGEVELPGDPPACYEVPVEAGQRARLQVVDGPDALFSVDGLAERQEDYAFVARDGPVRVRVTSEADAPFVLRVALTEAAEPRGWRVEEVSGRVSGLAWIGEEGGPSLTLTCVAEGRRLTLVYDGTGTVALMRPEAEEAEGAVEIEVDGERRTHPVTLRRIDGFDRYWEATEELAPMLDDFAAGTTLRLLDAEGAVAGRVGLDGSARLREAVARECGL